MRFLIPLFFLLGFAVITSCEKDITVELDDPVRQVVVEGYITPGQHPAVYLSYTAPFFAPIDTFALLNYTVRGALVTISDGTTTDTLQEPLPGIGYLYVAGQMVGQIGKTYNLRIVTADGDVITSTTTIPDPVTLDSVWFQLNQSSDSLGWGYAHLTDPAGSPNSYRIFTKRVGKDADFIPVKGSVFEDRFFDGLSFDFTFSRGAVPNSIAPEDNSIEAGYYKAGDTIAIRFASITEQSFDFWRSAETQAASNGNPFAAASPLKSNINGGIGIWEGFSFTSDTIVATP